jgi:Gram-negative bacterial TonB protein C-terminal
MGRPAWACCFIGLLALMFFVPVPRFFAQDISVRVEAVRLLEHANSLSATRQIAASYKHEVAFRSFRVDGTETDGRFNGIFSGYIKRFEWSFGNYHAVSIHYPDKIVQNGDYQPAPAEVLEMDRLTPLFTGWFDKSDIVESINETTLSGRPAKCVQFETVNGRSSESNQICIDSELGTLIRWNVGNERMEYSDYSQFQGVWLPAHTEHYINGRLRMVIDQTFSIIQGAIDWASLTPPSPRTLHPCVQYKRAVIQSAPQPSSAGPGPWYNVKIHAVIGADGRVHEIVVLPEGRPDLERQAVQTVSGWTFSPALCNGKPIPVNASLVVHFPPP